MPFPCLICVKPPCNVQRENTWAGRLLTIATKPENSYERCFDNKNVIDTSKMIFGWEHITTALWDRNEQKCFTLPNQKCNNRKLTRAASKSAQPVNALFILRAFSLQCILSCICKFPHLFLSLLTSISSFLQWFLLYQFLHELLSMHMTQHCYVLRFTILCLFNTKSPSHFPFILKNANFLIFVHPHFEGYRFPVESLLTLSLWNKVIIIIIVLLCFNNKNVIGIPSN